MGSGRAYWDLAGLGGSGTLGGGKVEQGGAMQGFPWIKPQKTNVGGKLVHRGQIYVSSKEMLNSN